MFLYFWLYITQNWAAHCIYLLGRLADEFMIRSPLTIIFWLYIASIQLFIPDLFIYVFPPLTEHIRFTVYRRTYF